MSHEQHLVVAVGAVLAALVGPLLAAAVLWLAVLLERFTPRRPR